MVTRAELHEKIDSLPENALPLLSRAFERLRSDPEGFMQDYTEVGRPVGNSPFVTDEPERAEPPADAWFSPEQVAGLVRELLRRQTVIA